MQRRCLVLFSGGLDSILACKILQEQGIDVIALKFITPFFSYELRKEDEKRAYCQRVLAKYGIRVEVIDISADYVKMLLDPPHGYGRYLNPCIDCKILMIKKAKGLLQAYDASFIATGEVLGQRPMSQRRDALRIIERDSGAEGLLLRPLSAKFLKETLPEVEGIVDRKRLPSVTGRSRKVQISLAKHYGIKDYPAPAGGCVLTDPILSKRFKRLFDSFPNFTLDDLVLAQIGRQFLLPKKSWLVVGRNKAENERLKEEVKEADLVLKAKDVPGPLAILRYVRADSDIELSTKLVSRYVKGRVLPCEIRVLNAVGKGERVYLVKEIPEDSYIQGLMF